MVLGCRQRLGFRVVLTNEGVPFTECWDEQHFLADYSQASALNRQDLSKLPPHFEVGAPSYECGAQRGHVGMGLRSLG